MSFLIGITQNHYLVDVICIDTIVFSPPNFQYRIPLMWEWGESKGFDIDVDIGSLVLAAHAMPVLCFKFY